MVLMACLALCLALMDVCKRNFMLNAAITLLPVQHSQAAISLVVEYPPFN